MGDLDCLRVRGLGAIISLRGNGRAPARLRSDLWPRRAARWGGRDMPLVLLDLAIVFGAYLAPLVLRFDGRVPSHYWTRFRELLPAILIVQLLSNLVFGLYGQMWRYECI